MKTFRLALVGALVLFGAASAFAQRVEVQRVQIQPKGLGVRGDAPLLTPDAVEKLKFTDAQKEKYAKIEVEYKDKAKAAQDAYRTAIANLRDREKFKEAQDKLQADSKKAREDGLGKVEPILTAEQKTVFAQVKNQQPNIGGVVRPPIAGIGGGIGQVLPPAVQNRLQLTDAQKKQIDAIQKEVEAKIMKVLTDEQRKQLENMKKPGIRPLPVQPANPAAPVVPRVRPAVPNVQPAPAVKRD